MASVSNEERSRANRHQSGRAGSTGRRSKNHMVPWHSGILCSTRRQLARGGLGDDVALTRQLWTCQHLLKDDEIYWFLHLPCEALEGSAQRSAQPANSNPVDTDTKKTCVPATQNQPRHSTKEPTRQGRNNALWSCWTPCTGGASVGWRVCISRKLLPTTHS